MSITPTIERVVRRLETRAPLDEADRDGLRALPFVYRSLDAATYLVREGETPEYCMMLLSGFAYRHKVTGQGDRQILSVHMPGELLDLQNSYLAVADHNVQALTRVELASVPIAALQALAASRPQIARAMWIDTLIDAAIFREWIVNVGRRDSITRISHLLCEFALRLRAAGLGDEQGYTLPMTQEQLADATGLTPVHVNRVLQELGRRSLIDRQKRAVTIVDWDRLRRVGDFSSRYLHIERGGPTTIESAA
ncbi:MAG TPA: Crp/Fnr family transcriptional regulator [Allosphingosinicella sp.]|nr:Crp/Fnr family transcriptional regulator [Allosphingosinicella sp.]